MLPSSRVVGALWPEIADLVIPSQGLFRQWVGLDEPCEQETEAAAVAVGPALDSAVQVH